MSKKEQKAFFPFRTSRIEALSDGVFAIAMTLLILEIPFPPKNSITSDITLLNYLVSISGKLYSFVLSFFVLGIYWIGHHNQFLYIKHVNKNFLWINIFFLMLISALPFSTGILGDYHAYKLTIVLYGVNLILIGIMLFIHWEYAVRTELIPLDSLTKEMHKTIQKRILLPPVMYAVAILVSFIDNFISLLMFFIVQVIYILPTSFDKKLKQSQGEKSE